MKEKKLMLFANALGIIVGWLIVIELKTIILGTFVFGFPIMIAISVFLFKPIAFELYNLKQKKGQNGKD